MVGIGTRICRIVTDSRADDEFEEWDDIREIAIQSATQLTTATISAGLLLGGGTLTADQVMDFFTVVYQRIRQIDEGYIDNSEGNGKG